MRKVWMMLLLFLLVGIPAWSQRLPETLLKISSELKLLSVGFSKDLQTLEETLTSSRNESTVILERHSTQLGDLATEATTSRTLLTESQTSQAAYRTYAQTALSAQADRLRALERERWAYRIGIVIAITAAAWAVIR